MATTMNTARGAPSRAWPIATTIAALVALGALGLAALLSLADATTLAVIRSTPKAGDAAAEGEPAVYAGTLHAGARTVTPAGKNASAFWAWVDAKSGKSRKTVCTKEQRTGLSLRTARGALALRLLEGDRERYAVFAEDHDPDRADVSVELAGAEIFDGAVPASVAADPACSGSSAEYHERAVPEGAPVEVLACRKGAELVECPGLLRGVIAAPSMRAHRDTLVSAIVTRLCVAAGVCLWMLGFMLVAAASDRAETHHIAATRARRSGVGR